MKDWILEEFSDLDLGDKRVNAKAKKIIDILTKHPSESIPTAFKTWSETKACYEFFANGKVTHEKILNPHQKATIERIRLEKVVLLPADTTEFNYTNKPSIRDLGNLAKGQGIYLHPLLAITTDRVPLGIVDANFYIRKIKNEKLKDHETYKLPIEEKELYRWIQSYKKACEVSRECPNTQVITITDREGDFAELFEAVNTEQRQNERAADIIVRAYRDRALKLKDGVNKEEEVHSKLISKLKNAKSMGEIKFTIPESQDRKARAVTQVLKTAQVSFSKRATNKDSNYQKVSMNAVMAIEETPPEGEEPLIWMFLTTLPIESFEQAALIVRYYLGRWEIEVFFKILKSGCQAEDRRLSEKDNLLSLLSILLVIAWRVMYIMKLGRIYTEASSEIIFSEQEWKSICKVVKGVEQEKPPLLGEMIKMIARLGGYLNRKSDPPPGPKVMWKGLSRMHDFAYAWEAFSKKKIR